MAAAAPANSARTKSTTRDDVWVAQQLVRILGGRFSREMGIDVDRGGREIDRWFLAATLFGRRISAGIAIRTYAVLNRAGVRTVADAGKRTSEELVQLLDEGGYVRYDESAAAQLHALAEALSPYKGHVAVLMSKGGGEDDAAAALDRLPGWGRTTVRLFLRELGRANGLDSRAEQAAVHLKLRVTKLRDLADCARLDPRDLEAALVRVALRHAHDMESCPGGKGCVMVAEQT